MSRRPAILFGMAGGALWAVLLLWAGTRPGAGQGMELPRAMAFALFPAGCVMALLVARLAQRRFLDDALIDGQPFAPGSPAALDQRVLSNTAEQVVLAAALWPLAGLAFGSRLLLALGAGLGLTRLLFWWGYRRAPALRAFGFAAGFYPTILAAALGAARLLAR